jgi:hypothetical protein
VGKPCWRFDPPQSNMRPPLQPADESALGILPGTSTSSSKQTRPLVVCNHV